MNNDNAFKRTRFFYTAPPLCHTHTPLLSLSLIRIIICVKKRLWIRGPIFKRLCSMLEWDIIVLFLLIKSYLRYWATIQQLTNQLSYSMLCPSPFYSLVRWGPVLAFFLSSSPTFLCQWIPDLHFIAYLMTEKHRCITVMFFTSINFLCRLQHKIPYLLKSSQRY